MSFDRRLSKICESTPIVDTHNDFPYLLRVQLHNEIERNPDFNFDKPLTSQTDLIKLKEGRVGIQFFSCYIECKNEDYLYQDFNKPNTAVRDTLEQIDVVRRLVDKYPHDMEYVTNLEQAMDAYKRGKMAITMGVEGLHQVDTSLAVIRRYHEMGVRYITLTHNCDNPFATAASSVVGGLPDKGLSDYGKDCVEEMNRLGMMVDLSHVSYQTMIDALEISESPVIFSHSSVFALTPNERNVRDDVLLKLKENGGVVCINFFPLFISQNKDKTATIHDAADHIKYVTDLIGWDHVGFGSDFDGIDHGPKGLEDVSKYPDLIYEIMKTPGTTDEQIAKLMGKNVLRVWKKNEENANLRKGIAPIDSNWGDRIWKFFAYSKDFPELYSEAFEVKKNHYIDTQTLDLTRVSEE